jgi:hypothetical protein
MFMILHQKCTWSTLVLCTLSVLVLKRFYNFLEKGNININTALQGNNNQEKCGVGRYRVGGGGMG